MTHVFSELDGELLCPIVSAMWNVVLMLDRDASIETEASVGGLLVRTTLGTRALRVELIEAASEHDAHSKALVAANRFLDGVHCKHHVALAVDSSSWTGEDTTTRKQYACSQERSPLFVGDRVCVKMTNKPTGEVVTYDSARPGPLQFRHSDAQAYYRKAKLTEDVFDRFRYLFLTAEFIAGRICAATGAAPTDGLNRLELALNEVFADRAPLLHEAAATDPTLANGDVVHNVAQLLYADNRCALNHATPSQSKVPFKPADEAQVNNALPHGVRRTEAAQLRRKRPPVKVRHATLVRE